MHAIAWKKKQIRPETHEESRMIDCVEQTIVMHPLYALIGRISKRSWLKVYLNQTI